MINQGARATLKVLLGMVIVGLLTVGCGGQASPTAAPPPAAPAAKATTAPAAAATKPAAAAPAAASPAAKAATETAPAPPKSPVEIRVGHGLASEEQLWLMKARPDLTPNQGKWYTLTYTPFRANADRLNAFQAGQIDAATAAAPSALFARAQGLSLKTVAEICEENTTEGFNTTIMVNADAGINSIADLKGKTVAVVDYKSATDLWMREGLKSAGLNPDRDVQIVVVPFPTMGESLRSHKIDAGTFVQPFYAVEKGKGGVKDLFTSKTGVPFNEPLMVLNFSEDFLKKNPDVVRAFLADYVKINKWFLEHTKEGQQALIDAKFVATPPEAYLGAKDFYRPADARPDTESFKKLEALLIGSKWLDRSVVGELVDLSYLPK